eukprot:TRINITY_DN3232_c0_g1_i1.p1 TRINITY_DN3232_c0_g1~~TRINITY_DN3232_c0_g1_i1.p1  ORF type:complete len:624 (-),score=147.55 TRINITY_DN3232_c0_g1_i1:220-2070(-)
MLKVLLLCICAVLVSYVQARSFAISSDGKMFVRDGAPFRIVAGEIHPPRILRAQWQDRLHKMRMMGINTAQVYVFWNIHEPSSGVFSFDGQNDLAEFIRLAQKEDLLVVLRTGPYICGEWDWGGLPSWFRSEHPKANIRRMDSDYTAAVERYYNELLPRMKPLLYVNGGPIISAQVENEYGSYSNDKNYLAFLRDLLRKHLGNDVIVHSTDGYSDAMLKNTNIDGVYQTVDFGVGVDPVSSFANQHKYTKVPGPNYNTEFYTGWLTHWGEKSMAHTDTKQVATALDNILKQNNYTSVSFYMIHGGTNWGFYAGANGDALYYQPHVTSYDYDAPISESGQVTEKWFALQEVLKKYVTLPPGPQPIVTPKDSYGPITLTQQVALFDVLDILTTNTVQGGATPLTYEEMKLSFGLLIYDTLLDSSFGSGLKLLDANVRDRAYVYLQGRIAGNFQRPTQTLLITLPKESPVALRIIAENQGRINYGAGMDFDTKGITSKVTINTKAVSNWTMRALPLEPTQIAQLASRYRPRYDSSAPAFYRAVFNTPTATPRDTYLDVSGWGKGIVWVNGFNLGRYWPAVGPQHTLYVPADILKPTGNDIVLLELEKSVSIIKFVDKFN